MLFVHTHKTQYLYELHIRVFPFFIILHSYQDFYAFIAENYKCVFLSLQVNVFLYIATYFNLNQRMHTNVLDLH